jgi:hypothetical protein
MQLQVIVGKTILELDNLFVLEGIKHSDKKRFLEGSEEPSMVFLKAVISLSEQYECTAHLTFDYQWQPQDRRGWLTKSLEKASGDQILLRLVVHKYLRELTIMKCLPSLCHRCFGLRGKVQQNVYSLALLGIGPCKGPYITRAVVVPLDEVEPVGRHVLREVLDAGAKSFFDFQVAAYLQRYVPKELVFVHFFILFIFIMTLPYLPINSIIIIFGKLILSNMAVV